MTRVLVAYCQPVADSLIGAALARTLAGLEAVGAEFRIHDLYGDGFEPELSAAEHGAYLAPGVDPSLQRYVDDLRWCDTLVFVYPTWWAGQPAMLKGWFDRVWACGVAWESTPGADRITPLLGTVRRLVVVTAHGSPKYVNALEGEGGKRTVFRSLRAMCHPRARTHWIALYGVDTSSQKQRAGFLDRVERKVSHLAARRSA